MSRSIRLAFAVVIVVYGVSPASAQVTTGMPPFGSFGGGPDLIDLANFDLPPSSAHGIIRHSKLLT